MTDNIKLHPRFNDAEKANAVDCYDQEEVCAAFGCDAHVHTPNIAMLSKVADVIFNPVTIKTWDQGSWGFQPDQENVAVLTKPEGTEALVAVQCTTSFCFAGHTVLMEGAEMDWENGEATTIVVRDEKNNGLRVEGRTVEHCYFRGTDNQLYYGSIEFLARHLLGLYDDQANELFSGNNTLAKLETLLDDLGVEVFIDNDLVERRHSSNGRG